MGICKMISGLLVLVAGAALLLFGFGMGGLSVTGASKIAGGALLLFGLMKFVHIFGMCTTCSCCCVHEKKGKK